MVATILVLVVNFENALEIWHWSWVYAVVLFGTIALHFGAHILIYSTMFKKVFKTNFAAIGVAERVLSDLTFWLTLFLICAVLFLPIFARE